MVFFYVWILLRFLYLSAIYFVWLRGFRWCFLIYWCWIPNAQQSNIHCFIRQNDIFVHSIYLCLVRIICEAKEKRLETKSNFLRSNPNFVEIFLSYIIYISLRFLCARNDFSSVSHSMAILFGLTSHQLIYVACHPSIATICIAILVANMRAFWRLIITTIHKILFGFIFIVIAFNTSCLCHG